MIELLRECRDALGNIHTYAHKTDFVLKESSDMLKRLDAALAGKDAADEDCGNCHRCLKGKVESHGIPVTSTRMIVCPDCGNKRCPKASDHRLACTVSNEPGQPGSVYGNVAPQPSTAEWATAPSSEGVGQGEVAEAAAPEPIPQTGNWNPNETAEEFEERMKKVRAFIDEVNAAAPAHMPERPATLRITELLRDAANTIEAAFGANESLLKEKGASRVLAEQLQQRLDAALAAVRDAKRSWWNLKHAKKWDTKHADIIKIAKEKK